MNIPDERRTVYEQCVSKWGPNAQWDQLVEECAELIVAVNHHRRGKIDDKDLASELADVYTMIEQMASTMYLEKRVDEQIQYKIERTKRRAFNK